MWNALEGYDEEKINVSKSLKLVEQGKEEEMEDILIMGGFNIIGSKLVFIVIGVKYCKSSAFDLFLSNVDEL